jgi:hypothetical protein
VLRLCSLVIKHDNHQGVRLTACENACDFWFGAAGCQTLLNLEPVDRNTFVSMEQVLILQSDLPACTHCTIVGFLGNNN